MSHVFFFVRRDLLRSLKYSLGFGFLLFLLYILRNDVSVTRLPIVLIQAVLFFLFLILFGRLAGWFIYLRNHSDLNKDLIAAPPDPALYEQFLVDTIVWK